MQFLLPSIHFSLCRLHINEIKHCDSFESGFSHSTHFSKTHFCSVDAHEGCLQLKTIMNKATRNIFCESVVLVPQSSRNLCDLMDCSLTGSSVHGILQTRILEWVASHSLLWGIFLTQGSNTVLLHCRRILYHLSHEEGPGTYLHTFCVCVNIKFHFLPRNRSCWVMGVDVHLTV